MAFHLSPSTGIIIPCTQEICEHGERLFPQVEDALEERELMNTIKHGGVSQHYDYSFDPLLERAVEKGFRRANPGDDLEAAQLALLLHPEAVHAIGRSLKYTRRDKVRRRIGRTLTWIAKEMGEIEGKDIRQSYLDNVAPHIQGEENVAVFMEALMSRDATPMDLLNTSSDLWVPRSAPLHRRAKYLLFAGAGLSGGYTPQGSISIAEERTPEIAEALGINPGGLPTGVVAFDLETDTTNGFGLLPLHSQITEIVLSDAKNTLVISGDEELILKFFRDEMNRRSQEGAFTLAGWNNRLFDNIFLQSRAEHHMIQGWKGVLTPVDNCTPFEPCGPTENAYSLSWSNSPMVEIDLFQERARQNSLGGERRMDSLKDFLSAHDAHPIRVERNAMHLLGEEERLHYALSDGVCTLRAHSLVLG